MERGTRFACRIGRTDLEFEFNPPERSGIFERFDPRKYPAYSTSGVVDLLWGSRPYAQMVIGGIYRNLLNRSESHQLDYLQRFTIDGTPVWALHNGEYMTLMLPGEY